MLRVLILDDDPSYARPLARRLDLEFDDQIQTVIAQTLDQAVQIAQDDPEPFDAFLIDERLGTGKDGIGAMEELKRLRPAAECIIFTGFDDPGVGYRALKAGAWCYLPKTGELVPELIWRLRSLQGLRMLDEAMDRTQRAYSLEEVADIVVQSGLQLGFERARLWQVDDRGQILIGLKAAGVCVPAEMTGSHISLDKAPYARQALTSPEEVTRFRDEELGPGYLTRQASAEGDCRPVGDWLVVPLRADGQAIGLLVLDNVAQAREITAEQHWLLRRFSQAASGALERAWRHEREHRLNEIGARIMTQAAYSNLDKLLKRLREELGRFTNAHNFIAALVEEEGSRRYLHYRMRYEDGRCQPQIWRPLSEPGLLAHVIERNEPLFLDDAEQYRAEHGLRAFGKEARSWMGVPLRVKGKAVGVIALENNRRTKAYTRSEYEQFLAVVEHVQGAIHIARLEEQQEQNNRRLRLLQRASEELMKLANEKGEDALWLAALTVATADYGLQFNRAALFLATDGGSKVVGRAGIGHFDRADAHRAWEEDRRSRMDFDRFLNKLRRGELKPTPVHCEVHHWEIALVAKDWDVFRSVLSDGQSTQVPASKAARRLPAPFVERFGDACDYAVIPLRAGPRVIGLAVVDNAHDGKPIRKFALDYLETLLAHAALTYVDYKQRKAYERLNALTCKVLAHAGQQPLKSTLTEICEVACDVAGVDCATVVPVTGSDSAPSYVLEQAGAAGWRKAMPPVRQPRPGGVTEYVLRTGMLVVDDVAKHADMLYAGQPITEHPLLREEGVRALIYAAVRAAETGETLSVLKLYYRSPQTFGKSDITQAEMFAELAAVAIQNWRAAQQSHAAVEEAEAAARMREREITVHQRVMTAALQPNGSQEAVIRALLDAAREIMNLPQLDVKVALRTWERDLADAEPYEIRREYYLNTNGELQHDQERNLFRGAIGRALESGQPQCASDAVALRETSQLVVPILRGDAPGRTEAVGALSVESPSPGAFDESHVPALERLAGVAARALDNARCLADRRRVLEISHAIAAPIALNRTLEESVRVMRDIVPDLSILTIWHLDMATREMKPGKFFGVRNRDALEAERATEGGIVRRILGEGRPRFVEEAEGHALSGDFVAREGVQSFAALPLRAENEGVGVMFLSYRHPHRFSEEERFLLETLSNLVASSIRDAALLEYAGQQRDQRDLAQRAAEDAATTSRKDEALRRIMARLKDNYPHAAIAIYTYDRAEHVLKVAPASLDFYPFEDTSETGVLAVDDHSIAGHVARRALEKRDFELYNCPNADDDPYFLPGTEGMKSELCVSLMSVNRDLLGVLILESPRLDAFDEDDEEQIRGIARTISLVLERAKLGDQLVYQTALAMATGGFVDFAHVARPELWKIRRRAIWLSQKEPNLSEDGRRWVREIDESAARLRQIFNEAQMGDYDAKMERLPFDALVRELIEEAYQRRPPAKVALEWDLKCGDVLVEVNRKALRWTLDHLVGNAVDAMGGAGRLTLRTWLRAGQWAEVRLEDDGPGVDPALRSILFQRAIPDRPGRGTGLLRVRQYVESMGGTIRLLESEPGQGAIFAITLRVAAGSAGA